MLTRREVRRSQRTSTATSRPAARRRSASGITTWFDTMVETRDGGDDHHRGSRGEAAEEGEERQVVPALMQRQGQDEEVGVGRPQAGTSAPTSAIGMMKSDMQKR